MKRRILIVAALLALLLGALAVGAAAADQTLQDAINNAANGATITLTTAVTEPISVDKDLVLDLNGNNISELNVAAGKTVTVFDSKTDDYAVSDNIYGKIYAHSGNVVAAEGYLAVTEDTTALSFHKLTLEITAMSLRSETDGKYNPSVYYKSNFCGDEVVAKQVAKYGIALNVKEAPSENNMGITSAYSAFNNFQAGEDGNAGTGTLLKGIIKGTNSDANNQRNANMPIYGRPYVQLRNSGEYIFGKTVQRSLKRQLEMVDNNWSNYSPKQQEAILWMFRDYKKILSGWDITNILGEMNAPLSDGKTLKLLAITSSFGLNSTQFLYDAAIAEGFENVVVGRLYASGCTLQTHVECSKTGAGHYDYSKNNSGKWVVKYNTPLLEGLQDEDWDIIFFQQSADKSPFADTYVSGDIDYIDELVSFVKANKTNPKARFVWNLCWAFQGNCIRDTFEKFNNDQLKMYDALIETLKVRVLPKTHFDAIIPTGTAVQNLRTSHIGDNLAKPAETDRIHLNYTGRVLAAYNMLSVLTGKPVTQINLTTVSNNYDIVPEVKLTEQDKLAIIEAANNAIINPYEITPSTYTAEG